MKSAILIFGNCQGEWIAKKLSKETSLASNYEIVYVPSYGAIPTDHYALSPAFLERCTHLFWQTPRSGKGPSEYFPLLPANCRQFRLPTLFLKTLWPTFCVDPRNKPEQGFPWGRFPYGDRIVLKLMEEGVSAIDIPKRYVDMDIKKVVNLDSFYRISFAEMRLNDSNCDITMTDFIENNFREQRMFSSFDHPMTNPMAYLLQQLVRLAFGNINSFAALTALDDDAFLGIEEIPIHPQVIEHFGLKWTKPGIKYTYRSAMLTIEEYIEAYVQFKPIAFPPN